MTTERRTRRIKPSMTYRMPPDIEQRIDTRITTGEFTNRADAVTRGLRFWLDFEKFDVRNEVREYLKSDEGIELVQQAARKHRQKK